MNATTASAESVSAISAASYWPDKIAREVEKSEKFRKVLKELDAMLGTPAERARRRAEAEKAQEAKEERRERIEELYAKLAELRGMLASKGGSDTAIEGQIAQIQAELFWMMFSF